MFRSRSKGRPVLVADIEDGSVGVSIVTFSQEGPAEVILSERKLLTFEARSREQAAVAITQLLEETTAMLLTALAKRTDKVRTPEHIYAILRAPWTRFRTVKTEETFAEPRAITKEIIATLARKALTEGSELDRNSILEAGVMQVFLNGYPTANPLGKRANSIAVVAFESDIDATMKSNVIGVFGKLLPGRTTVMHSGTRALLTVMHERLSDIHRFMLLDIGGATSSCSVVRREAVTQHAVTPEGFASILRRVSTQGLPEETASLLRMLATDSCSTTACQDLKDSLARAEPELVRIFGEVLGSLAARRPLPNAAMLFAPVEISPWLQSFFSRIDFSQFTATTQPLTIETLTPEHLLDTVHWKPGVVPDTGIGIASSCVNILEYSA